MGRYAARGSSATDRIVEEACRAAGAEIDAMRIPRLKGVVLGGGYARGEGGVVRDASGAERLSNDLDFYVVAEDGSSPRELAAIGEALSGVSRRWSERLSIDADFSPAKTPSRMKRDEERIMIQELVRGWIPVAGEDGKKLFGGIALRDAKDLPWMEAARLLMNRGMGLMLAKARADDAAFVARNLNKAVLGAGDALLVARGEYRWTLAGRAEALRGDALYRAAAGWKLEPREEAPFSRGEAREAWLAAWRETMARAPRRALARTFRSAARWIARRKSLGPAASFGRDPVARVLECVARGVERDETPSASLLRDWRVFN